MKRPDAIRPAGRTGVLFQGKELVYFAGCDYFRLSTHPEIIRAVAAGLKKYGLTVSASRVTTGNHPLYLELENALAKYFSAPAALLVSNGYGTNSIVAQALQDDFSHVLIDSKSHVSLRDAARFFRCPILEFENCNTGDLHSLIVRLGRKAKPILLTDGVFTHDVKVAPLAEYLKILGPRGTILLDDAHGAGVIGQTGRGSLELVCRPGGPTRRLFHSRVIQTVTLSKAFGAFGGAILCSAALREKIVNHSHGFAGSTPLPLPIANAALSAVQLLGNNQNFLQKLQSNSDYVKSALRTAGITVPETPVPVIAIVPKNPAEAKKLRRQLLAHRVYPSFVKYPGGPSGGYFRFVISSEHTRKELNRLLASLVD